MFLVYIDGFMSSNPSWHQPNPRYQQQQGVPPHVYGTNPMAPPPFQVPTTTTPTPTTTWGAAPPHFYGTNNNNNNNNTNNNNNNNNGTTLVVGTVELVPGVGTWGWYHKNGVGTNTAFWYQHKKVPFRPIVYHLVLFRPIVILLLL